MLQPLSNSKGDVVENSGEDNQKKHADRVKDSNNPGPWSIDWLANQQSIYSGWWYCFHILAQ